MKTLSLMIPGYLVLEAAPADNDGAVSACTSPPGPHYEKSAKIYVGK
jgi:hypothetical protein